MSNTSNLTLPFLSSGQAQKHITVNETLLRLDALTQCVARSRTLTAQPASPDDGQVYILPSGQSGADWGAMSSGSLAYYRDGAWEEVVPREGWRAFVADESQLCAYSGAAWSALDAAGAQRNTLINGAFAVWQRGTSFSTAGYCADRWALAFSGGAVTVSRQAFTLGQTDVPGEPHHHVRIAVSGQSAAADYARLRQPVEGVRTLAGQTVTLSFYAKADAPATLSTELSQHFGSGGSPSADVAQLGVTKHALTTSWQRFVVTLDVPPIAGKTLGTDKDALVVAFWASAGADFNTSTDSLGVQTATIDIACVQLEAGAIANPFRLSAPGEELTRCQRYFELLPGVGGSPGTGPFAQRIVNNIIDCYVTFKTQKRAAPTLVTSNPSFVTANPSSNNQIGYYSNNAGAYSTISGAFSLSLSGANPNSTILRGLAGTSFSSAAGHLGFFLIGSAALIGFEAEL